MSSTQTKQFPAVTFTLFPSLPPELQDHIWDLAVRPLPGNQHVHEFLIVDHYWGEKDPVLRAPWNGDPSQEIKGDFIRFAPDGSMGKDICQWGLAVPRDHDVRGPNTSAYLLDSGLWTACRRSRKALERFFSKNEWWSHLPGPSRGSAGENAFAGQSGVSHTASYYDARGEARHITILPETDLVHLLRLDFCCHDWHLHYAGDKYLIERCDSSDGPRFLGLNVALTFDPVWTTGPPASVVDMLVVLHDDTARVIWFIDFRLRRCGSSSASEKPALPVNREIFHSWGWKFTEVKEEDQDLWVINDEETKSRSVFDFFRPEVIQPLRVELQGSPRVRVLACEAEK
ncbi:hypothetical protein N7470_006932 [Penicillium chermesinum]|nr:hypothetical protein N7470_006932 [Penicillium chermesinum]